MSATSGTRILAVGSPHGDDRAGWEVVERLRREAPGLDAAVLHDPVGLLDYLEGCTRLVLMDACQSGAEPGTIRRLTWPAAELKQTDGASTHGLGVVNALALAEALGRLPPRVILFCIEAWGCEPGAALSPSVRDALPKLYQRVLAEIGRPDESDP
jgi:hydrogenase maturation protease